MVPKCPKCGNTAIDQIDTIQAKAQISRVMPDGDVEWSGETNVLWDSQEAVSPDKLNYRMWMCSGCGHCTIPNKFLPRGFKGKVKG